MDSILVTAFLLFILLTLLLWKISQPYFKSENGYHMWKAYGMKSNYWQGLVVISSSLTILFILLMKWAGLIGVSL